MYTTSIVASKALLLSPLLLAPTIAAPAPQDATTSNSNFKLSVAQTADGPLDLTNSAGPTDWGTQGCSGQIGTLCNLLGETTINGQKPVSKVVDDIDDDGIPDFETGPSANTWVWAGAGIGCQVGFWLPPSAVSPTTTLRDQLREHCSQTLTTMAGLGVGAKYNRLSINVRVPDGFPTGTAANQTGAQYNTNGISYIMHALPPPISK